MRKPPLTARIGAVFFVLWGLAHVVGGAFQLVTLATEGPGALTVLIASAHPAPADPYVVAAPAAAFMQMGAWTITWIGVFVTVVAIGLNWRNSPLGYAINMGVVGAADAGLVFAMLAPGHMSWSDGAVGLVLYAFAAVFATVGVVQAAKEEREPIARVATR
jgi:hypothetical protein